MYKGPAAIWLNDHAVECIVVTIIIWGIIALAAFGHLFLRKLGIIRLRSDV